MRTAIAVLILLTSQGKAIPSHCVTVVPQVAAARVIKTPVITYTQPYYQVGQQLQQQAAATQDFRSSPEYLEYLQLKGFVAGVQAVRGATPSPTPVDGPPQIGQRAALPSDDPKWDDFKGRYPMIAARCANCHGRGKDPENPGGGLLLNGHAEITPEVRDKMVEMVYRGHMPKGKPISDVEFGSLLAELYAERIDEPEAPEEAPEAPPEPQPEATPEPQPEATPPAPAEPSTAY